MTTAILLDVTCCPVCQSEEGDPLELLNGDTGWECYDCETAFRITPVE